MARDQSKGRGIYKGFLLIKYIQLPYRVYQILNFKYQTVPKEERMIALWYFVDHYFTNNGFEEIKDSHPMAYMICDILNEGTFSIQNNARWRCFDEFYNGDSSIDYETAEERYEQRVKESKKESNRKYYLKRKQIDFNPEQEHEEGKQNLKEAMNAHGIEFDDDDFDY